MRRSMRRLADGDSKYGLAATPSKPRVPDSATRGSSLLRLPQPAKSPRLYVFNVHSLRAAPLCNSPDTPILSARLCSRLQEIAILGACSLMRNSEPSWSPDDRP